MKSIKPIIISICVVVVFVALYLLLVFVFPESDESGDAAVSATPAPASETVYVIDREYDQLRSFEMIYEEGPSMLVEVIDPVDEDSNATFSVTPATEYFDYNSSLLRSMTYTVTSITAKQLVEEAPADLAQYGLDDPAFTMVTTYKDGSVVELYIGKQTLVDENFYCMTNESTAVYTIGNYVVSLLERSELEYRDITLFPVYEGEDAYDNINWVRLTQRDGSVIELALDTNFDMEGNVAGTRYAMAQPTKASGNDTVIETKVIDPVATLSKNSIVCDITPEEYAEYGFDEPARLEMTDLEGNSVNILIGDPCPNTDFTFIMLEGSPTVITAASTAFTWLEQNYVELMIRTVWYHSITDIASIDYVVDGESHTVTMEHYTYHDDKTDTDKKGINATLDGESFDETNARRLYVRTLNFRAIANVPADAVVASEPVISVTLHLNDGSVHTMRLLEINERQYAAEIDGTTEYYVYLKNLTTLREAFATVLDGDELEFSFN